VVLRSYDTRLRPTCRSPSVYLTAKVKKVYGKDLKNEPMQLDLPTLGRPILYLAKNSSATEDPDVRNFSYTSDIQEIDEETQQDCLWDKNGKLQLIETAFRNSHRLNVHEAQRPGDFLPIINHLQHLHEQNFVHGDIRAFNMVFDGEDGRLIDFDLSGLEGKTWYPLGYKYELPDALRCGHAHSLIEKHHDWYALGKVIFEFHEFQVPDNLDKQDKILLTFERTELSERFNKLGAKEGLAEEGLSEGLSELISELFSNLKDLLKQLDLNGWTCKASTGSGLYFYYHKMNKRGVDPATGVQIMLKNNSIV
jgi:Protein kinase domain